MLAIAIGLPIGIALHNRHESKLPTQDWRVPYRAPQFPAALEAHVRTSYPPVPQTYSPSLHIRNDPVPEVEQPPQLAGPLPSAELLIAMPGLVHGVRVDDGQPLIDHEIRSLLVGGQMGWGKSTLVALLAAQLHQVGARLAVGDPHASGPEGLTVRMRTLIDKFEVEQEPRLILQQVTAAWAELERRERLGDVRHLPPYVVIVDEFPELIRRLNGRDEERLRDALLVIGGLSGRKFKVAMIAMGQSWKGAVAGGTEMRDLLGAQAVFHMRKNEALHLTNLGSDYWNPDPLLLQKGEAFIVGVVSGTVLVRVPPVEAATRARSSTHFRPLPVCFRSTSTHFRYHFRRAQWKRTGSRWEAPRKRPGSRGGSALGSGRLAAAARRSQRRRYRPPAHWPAWRMGLSAGA